MQFSLRSLLIATFVLAVLLAVWFGYRRATMAQLTWLPLGSPQAEALFPTESVQATADGRFEFTYHVRRGRINGVQPPAGFSGTLSFHRNGQTVNASTDSPQVRAEFTDTLSFRGSGPTVSLSTDSESAAVDLLQRLRDRDVLAPGQLVIRGRVVDRKRRPLAGAIVDLMGPFVFINHFRTRDDGTFTMTLEDGGLTPPPGSGYYLRIRAPEETAEQHIRWHTPTFALDPAQPERVAAIIIPR